MIQNNSQENGVIKVVNENLFNSKYDLLVIPCSTQGTISINFKIGLDNLALKYLGEKLPLGEVQFEKIQKNISPVWIAYATSVEGSRSNLEAIQKIGIKIGEFVNNNEDIIKVGSPLLGTGAGNLNAVDAYWALNDGLLSTINRKVEIFINVIDNFIYEEITESQFSKLTKKNNLVNINRDNVSTQNKPKVFISFDYNKSAEKFHLLGNALSNYDLLCNDFGEHFYIREVTRVIEEVILVIILINRESVDSKWFRREFDIAVQLNKPIIIVGIENNLTKPRLQVDFEWIRNFSVPQIISTVNRVVSVVAEKKREAKNYWWLNIYPATWDISQFKVGQKVWFHSIYRSGNLRKNSRYFSDLKIGDNIIAYATGSEGRIVAIFEVTEAIHDENQKPVVNMSILKIEKGYKSKIELLKSDLFINCEFLNDTTSTIYPISSEIYQIATDVISSDSITSIQNNKLNISGYDTDAVADFQKDLLEISNDVRAFASLIAYKHLKPPLAIALFGNWGSGKSFFMKQLKAQLEAISKKSNLPDDHNDAQIRDVFCCKIVNIEFNAWHYMDADLWASLICHIFENLNSYVGNLPPEERREMKMYEELSTIKKILEETEQEKNVFQGQISEIEKKIQDITYRKKKEEENFKISLFDATKASFKSEEVQRSLRDAEGKLGIDKITDETTESLNSIIKTYDSTRIYVFEIMHTLFNYRRNWLGLSVLIFLPIALYYGVMHINVLDPLFKKLIPILTTISTFLAIGLDKSQKVMQKLKLGTEILRKTTAVIETKKMAKVTEFEVQIVKNEQILKSYYERLESIKTKIIEVDQKEKQIRYEIEQYQQGKLISNFIQRRLASDDYQKRLGLISTIRKDFEALSTYLVGGDSEKKIERIVLYIDDLDRCPKNRVIQVLEAIHLLLAFPLFVVIVGVDPRWVSSALKEYYPNFLDDPNEIEYKKQIKPDAKNGHGEPVNNATTLDYLEKIFQVPFSLKAISTAGINNLIEHLVLPQVKIEEGKKSNDSKLEENNLMQRVTNDAKLEANTDNYSDNTFNSAMNEPLNQHDTGDMHIYKMHELPPEPLMISPEEFSLMKSLGGILGNTPRTVKRYINTYRLIRSNENLLFDINEPMIDFASIMVLLVFVVHKVEIFSKVKKLLAGNAEGNFLDLFESHPEIKPLCQSFRESNDQRLLNLQISSLRKHLHLVSRYTFCIDKIYN